MHYLFPYTTFLIVAPVKALCSERFQDWSAKFESHGIICKELTGDSDADDFHSMKKATLILTTPVITHKSYSTAVMFQLLLANFFLYFYSNFYLYLVVFDQYI